MSYYYEHNARGLGHAYRDLYRLALRRPVINWIWSAFPLPGSSAYRASESLRRAAR